MAFNPEIYYARLVRETLKPCHLAELRKWLAGGSDACQTPDKVQPCIRECARTWLHLFNAIPVAPAKREKRAAEPYAMFKAMLAHPWCVAHLDALLEAEEDGNGWTTSVTSILARVPQGSRLIQRCFAAAPPDFVLGRWIPASHSEARYIDFRPVIDHLYYGLVPKALRSSTLDDVKRLLRLGECCAHAYSSESKERLAPETFRRSEESAAAAAKCLLAVEWNVATANPRDDVYGFAVQQWAACRHQGRRQTWLVEGMSQARYRLLWAAWPGNAMDALMAYTETVRDDGILTFPPALCAGLGKDECGGVGAYLTPSYPTARLARDAKVLLAPDWPARLLSACAQPQLPNWHDGAHKGCCPRRSCGASYGMRTLMADGAFTALDPAVRMQVLASIMGLTMHTHAVECWRYPNRSTWVGRAQCLTHLISGPRPKDGPDPAAFIHALTVAIRRTERSAYWGEPPLERLKQFLTADERRDSPDDYSMYASGYGLAGVQAALALTRTLEGDAELRIRMHGMLMAHLNRIVSLRETVRAYFLRTWKDRSSVIRADIAMMPPDRKTCPTGGTSYREGLLSYRLGSNGGGAFRPPPVPATPESLAWYVTHPATYSVKADGVSYEGPLPVAYPALADDFDVGAWTVRAEEMVVETNRGPRTIYLVFDAVSASSYTDTLCERMGLLRRVHRLAPLSSTYAADSDALRFFLRHLPEGCARRVWWPKWVGRLGPDPVASLRLLSEPPETSYKNDGWILTPLAEQCQLIGGSRHPPDIKVKPPHEMTADLSVDGAVWRCTWEGKSWVPREVRPEKRHPNPPEIVAFLEAYHRRPWNPLELAPFIQHAHYRARGAGALSSASGHFLRAQRALQTERLADLCVGARVLDVGAGRGRVARQVCSAPRSRQPLCWVGLDTDPVAVEEARLRPETQAHTWLWCDAATMAHPLTGERPSELEAAAYDVILAIHSIHHAASDEKAWQAWAQNLTALAAPGCTLVIATIDPTRLPAEPTELPDVSFIRPVKSLVAGASAYRISLAWANSAVTPVTEHYFAPERLAEDLARLGWEFASLRRGPTAQNWEAWADAHVWLVFRRA